MFVQVRDGIVERDRTCICQLSIAKAARSQGDRSNVHLARRDGIVRCVADSYYLGGRNWRNPG
jgi:hypothetical protein